jgi:hypothetical protein
MREFPNETLGRRAGALCAAAAMAAPLLACGGSKTPTQPSTPPATPPPAPGRTTQNPLGSASNVEARTSQIVPQSGPNTPTAQVFDDFTLTTGASLRTVAWQGIYCVEQANAPAPAPHATAFVLSFYADQNGQPNRAQALYEVTVPLSGVNETLDRTQANLNCGTTPTTWALYSYSTTLPSAFGATANVRYWISIRAVTPSFQTFWGWRDGMPDNRSSLQLVNGSMQTWPVDRAYSLAP